MRDCAPHAVVAALALALTWPASAGPFRQPPVTKRLDTTVRYSRGENRLAECSRSSTFSEPLDAQAIGRSRMLCATQEGERFVLAWEFDVATTAASRSVLADLESGEWLMITRTPELDPRANDESMSEWRSRLEMARRTRVQVETSMSRFDPCFESDVVQFRSFNWARITADHPGLAARVRWLLENFQNDPSTHLTSMVLLLADVVYSGEEVPALNVEATSSKPRVTDVERAPTEFEQPFGTWAEWPELPVPRAR